MYPRIRTISSGRGNRVIDFDTAWRHLQQTTKAPDDCQRWNKKAARYDSRDAKNLYAEAFVELAGVQPGETIFDMGCGTGTLAAEMATRGHKVIVGDFSSGMLAKLRENMALRDIKVAESLDALTPGSVFPLRMSWEDDWSQFGLHENMADIAFASRSIAVADLRRDVYKRQSKNKALMICDEVQCGMYRCGVPFAFQHYGITPDIVAMAKGIAGGVPMGACAARAEVADAFGPGDHGTTFGGSCLAITAANCVLDELGREGEIERIEAAGEHLAERLTALPHVKEVRGLGLMRAVEFDDSVDAPALVLAALNAPQGLVLNYTGAHTLRFLPPLIATNADIDAMADQLEKLIEA